MHAWHEWHFLLRLFLIQEAPARSVGFFSPEVLVVLNVNRQDRQKVPENWQEHVLHLNDGLKVCWVLSRKRAPLIDRAKYEGKCEHGENVEDPGVILVRKYAFKHVDAVAYCCDQDKSGRSGNHPAKQAQVDVRLLTDFQRWILRLLHHQVDQVAYVG